MTEKEAALTAERLRSILAYDSETGFFKWVSNPNKSFNGKRAGSLHPRGYVWIRIGKWGYAAHRLAWLFVVGRWPSEQLDHRNGVRNDNRIDNLRECAGFENGQNVAKYKNNKSGYRGVAWCEPAQGWRARIDVRGQQSHLGIFSSPEEASAAYLAAKAAMHSFQPVPRDA